MPETPRSAGRRQFLRAAAGTLAAAGAGLLPQACAPLPESKTRIEVPRNFRPRIVARSRYPSTSAADYEWHPAPDGGGCFATDDGGWIYVSNSENHLESGAGALRFAADGAIVDSYPVLTGTRHNCAGGVTPWGTWLSCEEFSRGRVWECDPCGIEGGIPLPALGVCEHESAAVDPETGQIYLTEDEKNGCLYRFTPDDPMVRGRPDMEQGVLEIARVESGRVSWLRVPDPGAQSAPLREQLAESAHFAGPEGIAIRDRVLRFTTKWDNSIWQLDLVDGRLRLFDRMPGKSRKLDNVIHTPGGEVLVAEDGDGMRIFYYPDNAVPPVTLLRIPDHKDSEVTGLAFDPGGTRLYFSSQRGSTGKNAHGITFELSGDFSLLSRELVLEEWILDHDRIRI